MERDKICKKRLTLKSRNIKQVKTKGEAIMDHKIYGYLQKERKNEERLKEFKIK